MNANNISIITLQEQPHLLHTAATWFHEKWGIPLSVYEESMQASIDSTSLLPCWYMLVDTCGAVIAGAGLIANDFHVRAELTPNICALYVEAAWRGKGLAKRLLDHIRKDAGSYDISRLYLITSHTRFYEACGWEFFSMIKENDGTVTRMYTASTL